MQSIHPHSSTFSSIIIYPIDNTAEVLLANFFIVWGI